MKAFKGKHVMITGAAKGIGRGAAEVFLRDGANVSGFDLDQQAMDELQHDRLTMYYCDVSDGNAIQKTLAKAVEAFGPVDILVNNAGINPYGTVTETSEELWDKVMNTNLKSAFLMSKAVIPGMVESGNGVIVNVSSVQAFITQDQVAAYTTSKTAMLGLTRSIAVDYAPNIRCVAVCPGTIDTPMFRKGIGESPDPQAVLQECIDMHLVKKIGNPSDVGEFIAYLASEKASFMTGQAFRIDGGLGIAIGGSKRK
jgi:NAD(P)-dependent dehydrogenase (short-subunit alcohol dehydrogenase family)